MDVCILTNTNNSKTAKADVLQRSDKRLRVVLQGTDTTITLTRDDTRRPYVGSMAGLEFTTNG